MATFTMTASTTAAPRWQTWNSSPFCIERITGKTPSTVILRFSGPFTLRDAYTCLPAEKLNQMLNLEPAAGEEPMARNILDLTACPYMDSSGLGVIVTHHVRCQKRGIRLVAAGMSPRVREIFRMTKVDTVISIVATMEEAEGDSF